MAAIFHSCKFAGLSPLMPRLNEAATRAYFSASVGILTILLGSLVINES